jgi:hypothetical protein
VVADDPRSSHRRDAMVIALAGGAFAAASTLRASGLDISGAMLAARTLLQWSTETLARRCGVAARFLPHPCPLQAAVQIVVHHVQ